MALLIFTLPLDTVDRSGIVDYVLSQDGESVSGHDSVALALLSVQAGRQTEVIALVPARALSWHQVQLPPGSLKRSLLTERGGGRLRTILEGLLEEQLLDDPAQLHMALQPQPVTDAPVWVAVCDLAWLQTALAAVASAGVVVSRIVPEFDPDALAQQQYVTSQAEQAVLAGWLQGNAEAGASGSSLLVCALSTAGVSLVAGSRATPLSEPSVAEQAEHAFDRPIGLIQRPQRMLQAARSTWDMAQFGLAHAGRRRRSRWLGQAVRSLALAPQWRAARVACLVLALIHLVGLNALALREKASLTAKSQGVRSVLMETFPKIPVVVDAPVQMARELAQLQRTSGAPAGADIESILGSFAAVVPDGYALTAIEFISNEARLTGPLMSDPAQSRVIEGMRAQGLRASVKGEQWLIQPGGTP